MRACARRDCKTLCPQQHIFFLIFFFIIIQYLGSVHYYHDCDIIACKPWYIFFFLIMRTRRVIIMYTIFMRRRVSPSVRLLVVGLYFRSGGVPGNFRREGRTSYTNNNRKTEKSHSGPTTPTQTLAFHEKIKKNTFLLDKSINRRFTVKYTFWNWITDWIFIRWRFIFKPLRTVCVQLFHVYKYIRQRK